MRAGAANGCRRKLSITARPSTGRTKGKRRILGAVAGQKQQHGNFDFAAWSPVPVGSLPEGRSRWGVAELVGNGWELTDTPFAPLPGFTPYIRSYPDYSADFFDGKHFVLKGASWATARDLVRPSFRNWYQAHYPYVFAKFRCVSDF